MLGKQHSANAKQKMSEAKKDKKNPQYKKRTPAMYNDIKNGMGPTEFKRKYNCSQKYFYNTKKEIETGLYN